MNDIWTLLTIAASALSLYQAGKFKTVMDYDRDVFEKDTPTELKVYYWLNLIIGLYLIIVVYGRGLERGLQ